MTRPLVCRAPGALTATARRPSAVAIVALAGLVGLLAAPARAQVSWDAPRGLGPDSPVDLGLAWVRFGDAAESEGVVGSWRPTSLPAALSFRAGAARDGEGEVQGFAGLDVRVPLARRSDGARADVSWSSGAGLAAGPFTRVSLPIELSVGRSWGSGAVWIAPYLSAGVAMDLDLGDEAPDEEFRLRPTVGAGLDLALDERRRFVLRAAAAFGRRDAVSIGAVLRGGGARGG